MAPSLTSFWMSVQISALQRELPDYRLVALYLLIPVYFFHSICHYFALYDTCVGLLVNRLSSPLRSQGLCFIIQWLQYCRA